MAERRPPMTNKRLDAMFERARKYGFRIRELPNGERLYEPVNSPQADDKPLADDEEIVL
jgi:hypothetical protein